jgi:hypothetical protein
MEVKAVTFAMDAIAGTLDGSTAEHTNEYTDVVEVLSNDKSALLPYRENLDTSVLQHIPEAVVNKIIQEASQSDHDVYNKVRDGVDKYLESWARHVTDPDDNNYNIIDQHRRKKWALPPNALEQFYISVEKMRVQKIPNGFSVRQNVDGRMFADFDILLKDDKRISDSPELIAELVKSLSKGIVEELVKPTAGQTNTFHVLVTTRDYVTEASDRGGYKDGIHMYVDITLPQAFRKYVIKKLVDSGVFSTNGAFLDVSDRIKNEGSILDAASATVPPLMIGAYKPNGINYSVFAVYELTHISDKQVKLRKMALGEYERWNIAARFSINYYAPGQTPNVIHPLPRIMDTLAEESTAVNNQPGFLDDDVETLDITSVNDPTQRELVGQLSLLGPHRADQWVHWSRVLMSIAQWGNKYKEIARKFSRKSTKYSHKNFEYQWSRALAAARKYSDRCKGIIINMAREDDPDGQMKFYGSTIQGMLIAYVKEVIDAMGIKNAHLGDFQMAKIIHNAFPNKYIAIPKRAAGNKKMTDDSDVSYYSLISRDSHEYRPGYAGKYMQIYSTAPIQIWISTRIPEIVKDMQKRYNKKRQEAEETKERNKDLPHCNAVISVLGKFYAASQSHGSKSAIMRQFAYLATDFQFEYQLDIYSTVMGVYDAILEIGPEPRIIRGANPYKITRTSLAKFRNFDPKDKKIQEVVSWFMGFILDDKFDKLLFILIFFSQSMTSNEKIVAILNLIGCGKNAKSTLMNLHYNTFGDVGTNGYAHKLTVDYLTQTRTNSSAAQSELMPLKYARTTTLSEPGAGQRIMENKLKTLLSGETMTSRGLYENEQNFSVNSSFILGSNNEVKMEGGFRGTRKYAYDFGTLRRVIMCGAECFFTSNPDPKKPHQRKADPKIMQFYVKDPEYHGAYLSLLSIVYSLFMMQHEESIMNICSPNIARETDTWRRSFDTIDTFINSRCVKSPKYECNMTEVIDCYIAWHDGIYGPSFTHDRDQIMHAFLQSKLENFIKPRGNAHWAIDIRTLQHDQDELTAGEERFMRSDEFDFKDYRDYKMPPGMQLPFLGKITPTTDPENFLQQLSDLHKAELAAYKLKNPESDPYNIGPEFPEDEHQ